VVRLVADLDEATADVEKAAGPPDVVATRRVPVPDASASRRSASCSGAGWRGTAGAGPGWGLAPRSSSAPTVLEPIAGTGAYNHLGPRRRHHVLDRLRGDR
jgi:hypothetical protein